RGGIELDVEWRAGKAMLVVLRPGAGGEFGFRSPRGQQIAGVLEQGKKRTFAPVTDGVVNLKLVAGREYRISFS
ncbi:MAG: hypothetical protein ACRD6N_13795, partial [Pyrinomonadaceae bacterium]